MAAVETPAMTVRPERLTRTPSVDVLADVLRAVRVSGGVFFHGEFPGAWAVTVNGGPLISAMLALPAKNLMMFHVIDCGQCTIDVDGASVELRELDVVVLPYGDEHTLRSASSIAPIRAEALFGEAVRENGLVRIRGRGDGPATGVVCGFCHCDAHLFNPLLRGLPKLVHVRAGGSANAVLAATVRSIVHETRTSTIGSACILARLSEVLVVEALRRFAAGSDHGSAWFVAIADPLVGPALRLLHADPTQQWTVVSLARAIGTSRSLLAERFATLLGEPPISYLTSWRLQLAAERLSASDASVAAIAESVGYGSEAAFHRAFKRRTGEPPAAWRVRRTRSS
jgi:AraC family transcriptional regulator, alkane utilization regulator